jgi:glutathionylspermidine synthase
LKIRSIEPRPDWRKRVVDLGLTYIDNDGEPYWTEDRYVEFSQAQIEEIEAATLTLHHLCLDAVDAIVRNGWLDRMQVPAHMQPLVVASWNARDPYVFGRFDLAYDGKSQPKMIEYNADTPAGTIEGSVVTWDWVEQNRARGLLGPETDHFNGIDDAMVNAWTRAMRHRNFKAGETVWFATRDDNAEAEQNLVYMMEIARQAGLKVARCDIREVGFNAKMGWFVDKAGMPIRTLFKHYEWEAMANEDFSRHIARSDTLFIEPVWKMLLSNKALLPILWELNPGHPNLLPAYFEEAPLAGVARVRKPVFSMEGQNVAIIADDGAVMEESDGEYLGDCIWQAYAELPSVDGEHLVIGSWVSGANPRYEGLAHHEMGGDPCGIVVRTHAGLITGYNSRIMPHVFEPDATREPVLVPQDRYVA